jgi:hypothetical protein
MSDVLRTHKQISGPERKGQLFLIKHQRTQTNQPFDRMDDQENERSPDNYYLGIIMITYHTERKCREVNNNRFHFIHSFDQIVFGNMIKCLLVACLVAAIAVTATTAAGAAGSRYPGTFVALAKNESSTVILGINANNGAYTVLSNNLTVYHEAFDEYAGCR